MAASVPYVLPDTQNQAWSSDTSRFGHKMLSKFGWTSGKGLGKKEDGMTGHVRVSKRLESLGLGARTASSGGEVALSSTMSDYDNLLASLRPTKRARSESESEEDSSSSEEEEESGGEGEGKGKGKKVKAPTAPVRIIGRFAHHRALRQKNVAGYSEADLAAILGTHTLGSGGTVGGAGESVALPSAPEVQRASLTLSVRKKKAGEGKKAKKSKEEKQEKRERKEKKRAKKDAKRERRREEEEGGGKKKKSKKQ